MDILRVGFNELFTHIISYLHPIDCVSLSMTAKRYADCANAFSQWRCNIEKINDFILTIDHQIADNEDYITGDSFKESNLRYNGKTVFYGYYDAVFCAFIEIPNYSIKVEILNNGKVSYKAFHIMGTIDC